MSNNTRQQEHHGVASERVSTPVASATSRASTEALEKGNRGASVLSQQQVHTTPPKMTPSTLGPGSERVQSPSDAQLIEQYTKDVFQPYQMLMETEITLEYGKNLKEHKVVHKEMLCCHSDGLGNRFKKAESLREAYATSDRLRKYLKDFVHPRLSHEDFEDLHREKQTIPLLVQVYEHYPLKPHRQRFTNIIDGAIAEQVGKKHVIAPQAKGTLQKRDLPGMGIQSRLEALQSKGVLAVVNRVSEELRVVKQFEKDQASSDPIKAAAQGRIILRNTDARVVRSLVQWMYCHSSLNFQDAEHLYTLHVIASRLGMTVLAETCLTRLLTETNNMIEAAFSKGLTLQEVLNHDSGAGEESATPAKAKGTNNVVQVVFDHVLQDAKCPSRLLDLVVSTLADCLEPGLWQNLVPRINHQMSLLLIEAMLQSRQIKIEEEQDRDVMPEST